MMFPYLIEDKRIISNYVEVKEELIEFDKLTKEFAEMYNAKPELNRWGREVSLNGIIFNKPSEVDYSIWTKPLNNHGTSRIRTSKPKVADREKLKKANDEYEKNINLVLGKFKTDDDMYMTKKGKPFMAEFGVSSNTWISYSFKLAPDNSYLLLESSEKLNASFLKEILVSEFMEKKNVKV